VTEEQSPVQAENGALPPLAPTAAAPVRGRAGCVSRFFSAILVIVITTFLALLAGASALIWFGYTPDTPRQLGEAQAQLATIDLQRAALDQEQAERDAQFNATLVAPISGVVGTVLVEAGQVVAAGTTLATLIPSDATLEAHLYTPSRSIGFIRDGQVVLLRYLAYPHQKFGSHRARVAAVSKNPEAPSSNAVMITSASVRARSSQAGSARTAAIRAHAWANAP